MNEVLLIDKPVGITSYKVIEEFKKLCKTRKIGHSGTLDKFASGLLILCTGWATKLTRYFIDSDKRYIGTIKLGVSTDTCDVDGRIIHESDTSGLNSERIIEIKEKFSGEIWQVPPKYSALKVGGRRASDLIREGKTLELEERRIFVKKLEILSIDLDNSCVTIDVVCSKGTYIRALARDIGVFLETGAHLKSLRRIASGIFTIENAVTIDEYKKYLEGIDVGKDFCYSPEKAVSNFGSISVKENSRKRVLNGVPLQRDEIEEIKREDDDKPFRILDDEKNLIAIADVDIDNWNINYLNVFNRK